MRRTAHYVELTHECDEISLNHCKDAFVKEVNGMVDSGSLSKPMKLPKGRKAIKCRTIGKIKDDGTWKWRWVPKGYMQMPGIDFDERNIEAPVVDTAIVRMMIKLGNLYGAKMRVCDVFMAFLNAELVEEIYMYAPAGIDIGVDDDGNPLVFRLLRAVYGLKQSPAAWNDLLDDWLKSDAPGPLAQSDYDRCFFHGWRNDHFFMLSFHVDDFLIVTNDEQWEKEFMTAISTRFKVKDLGALGTDCKSLLGLSVTRTLPANEDDERTITISTPKVLNAVLNSVGMKDVYPSPTPAVEPKKSDLVSAHRDDYEAKGMDPPSVVGSLGWAATKARPDLTVVSSVLGSERHDPTVAGIRNMERCLQYASGTIDLGITYRDKGKLKCGRKLKIVLWCDSDWAGDDKVSKSPQGRSRGGYVLFVEDGVVLWMSKLRDEANLTEFPDLSSTSAEIGTMSDAGRRLMWVIRTLVGAGFEIPPATIFEDNQAAIKIAERHTITERTRHLHIRDLYIRQIVNKGYAKPEYVKSSENLADFFTKILPQSLFRKFRDRIMGIQR